MQATVQGGEAQLRKRLVRWAASLFQRGYTAGASGNISARCGAGFLMTPTNSCLGFLDADRLARLDADFAHVEGDPPSKEVFLHRAFYAARPDARAVVHLHSTFATALSCLADTDRDDAIAPITPYVVMRVGRVPVVSYSHPGDAKAEPMIERAARGAAAVLLANHGPVVAGASLDVAVFAAEELEETAKLAVLLHGRDVRHLTQEQVAELRRRFVR